MKYWACLLAVVFLAACGGEEQECKGLDGKFFGYPVLDFNSCFMAPPFLRPTSLDATKLTDEQKSCGVHDLLTEVREVDGCTRTVTNILDVNEERYVGFVRLEVKCGEGTMPCVSVWRVEFVAGELRTSM